MATRCYGCMQLRQQPGQCEHCGYSDFSRNEAHQLPLGYLLHGQYRVGRVLGQGGFGITYLCWNHNLEIPVAIKEYYPRGMVSRNTGFSTMVISSGADEQIAQGRDRFLKEARTLGRLRNLGNIVQVFDSFQENGTAYIVMEYVEGITLQEHVRQRGGRLTAAEAFAILQPVLKALHKVHEAGMIHRDISPDNIMLQKDGTVKLLDFGTARDLDSTGGQLTHSTQAVLKHGFAPMEQYASGKAIDRRADEYALGATIYYCLTGKVPQDAASMIMEGTRMEWGSIPGLTEQQKKALEKATAFLVDGRFADLAELEKALFPAQPEGNQPIKSMENKNRWPPAPPEEILGKKDDGQEETTTDFLPRQRYWKESLSMVVACVLILVSALAVYILKNDSGSGDGRQAIRINDGGEGKNIMVMLCKYESTSEFLKDTELKSKAGKLIPIGSGSGLMESYYQDLETNLKMPLVDRPDLFLVSDPYLDSYVNSPKVMNIEELGVQIPQALRDAGWVKTDKSGNVEAIAFQKNTWFLVTQGTDNPTAVREILNLVIQEQMKELENRTRTAQSWRKNTLINTEETRSCVFGYEGVKKEDITSITFLDSISDATSNSWRMWDASQNQDASVMAWTEPAPNGKLALYIAGNGGVKAPASCNWLFDGYSNVREIEFRGNFHVTPEVTDMLCMFGDCASLEYLDLRGFDTSNVQDFGFLLYRCHSLKAVNLSSFDTSNAVFLGAMFYECKDLKTVDLRNFNTAKVLDMGFVFYRCESLTDIDLSSFNTSSAIKTASMFHLCKNLKALDVRHFNTSSVTDMSRMFVGCASLTELDVSSLDTSRAEDMMGMFWGCQNLQALNVSHFNTARARNMGFMFADCRKLESLDLGNFNTSSVTDMNSMFALCASLTTVKLDSFSTAKVTNMGQMFYGCENLKNLDLSKFNTSKVTDMSEMFAHCGTLPGLKLGKWEVKKGVKYDSFMDDGVKYNGKAWKKLFA